DLEQGFAVARGFFGREEVAALLAEVEQGAAQAGQQDQLTEGGLVFTTNLFRRSRVVQALLAQQRLLDFLRPIAGGDLWVRWDQAVSKRPGAGEFRWHQDNAYNRLRTEHVQVWIALTETRRQNGALWLAPGSHKRGLLPHSRVSGAQVEVQSEVGESLCIDATAGDMIVFSSLMLHRTGPNVADNTRVAYVAEYMRMADYDYDVAGPYFVVATGGKSDPRFVRFRPGSLSLRNQWMYLRPRARKLVNKAKHPLRLLRDALRG
ncbi:MAG TPA: phytanoyl-CoA dioxygenase family protein, partial [Planctomycetota bacterium]|nr:phytanoyl-CoA dioxygenase family protein [Planctomycetota bacterium]